MNEANEIRKVLKFHLNTYLGSTVIDLYKSFFQDQYGPGHLLADEDAAWRFLNLELEEMKSQKRHIAEPCGLGRSFYRLSLDLVVDKIIDKNEYFEAFIASSKTFIPVQVSTWQQQWSMIVPLIKEEANNLPTLEEDLARIDALLISGSYVMSHSQAYRDRYDPHYRIFSITQRDSLGVSF